MGYVFHMPSLGLTVCYSTNIGSTNNEQKRKIFDQIRGDIIDIVMNNLGGSQDSGRDVDHFRVGSPANRIKFGPWGRPVRLDPLLTDDVQFRLDMRE